MNSTSIIGLVLFCFTFGVIGSLIWQYLRMRGVNKVVNNMTQKSGKPENAIMVMTITVYEDGNVGVEREVKSTLHKGHSITMSLGALDVAQRVIIDDTQMEMHKQ